MEEVAEKLRWLCFTIFGRVELWFSKGTPELEQHCLYQVVEDFKLEHQLGKADEQFKRRIKQSSIAVNEEQNCSSSDQLQRTRAVIECESRYKRSDPVKIRSQAGYDTPR
ncbi:hypothetical protein F511_41307 [Dorcoceras hygrometricum]|uniref:Uncharacterized protein n=1 Tax=Dorcoceras hygrometricum TaxID=472368 RepID=A0A2Z7A6X8_9LAMI|nr:hypothetical protein F511_41307 [Dorcoceras hygrometricum]